jgi:hypothetical protein
VSERRFYWAAIVDRHDISTTARLLYVTMDTYSNEEGECWPSVSTLAVRLGLGRRQVFELLAELEAAKVVARDPRPRSTTNFYHLLSWVPTTAPRTEMNGQLPLPQVVHHSAPPSAPQRTTGSAPQRTPLVRHSAPKQTKNTPVEQTTEHPPVSALEIVHAELLEASPPDGGGRRSQGVVNLDDMTALERGRYLDNLIAEVGEGRGARLSRAEAKAARALAVDRLAVWPPARVVAALVATAAFTTNALTYADRNGHKPAKTAVVLADFLDRHPDDRT